MWKWTCPYKLMERETHRHTHRNCPGSPGFVNYFPLEMNQPAAVWLLWLPPNQTVIWLGGESGRVERRGKLFHFGPTASASLRLNDPGDSKCQNVPQQHLLPPLCPDSHSNISQRSTNPVFSFSLWMLTTENNPPSYSMRMMLMSASHILMTQHINWVLAEVPLSLYLHKRFVFFLSGQVP